MQICITCQSHRSTLFQTQPVGRCKWFPAEYDVQSQGALLVPESPRYNLFSQEMESPANPGRFREAYWKEVFLSRGKFGYNKN